MSEHHQHETRTDEELALLAQQGDDAALEYLLNKYKNFVRSKASGEAIKYVLIVITMIPVMIIYPFVQKYFIKGIMIGSIKG